MSICPSVQIAFGPYLSYGEILEVPTSLKDCLWPEKVSLSCLMSFVQVQGHCCKKMQNFWAISCNGKWVEVKSWHKYHPWPENMSLPWVLVICACSNWEIIELYFLSWGRRVRERVKLVSLLTVSLVDLAVCGELDIHVWKFDWKKKFLKVHNYLLFHHHIYSWWKLPDSFIISSTFTYIRQIMYFKRKYTVC